MNCWISRYPTIYDPANLCVTLSITSQGDQNQKTPWTRQRQLLLWTQAWAIVREFIPLAADRPIYNISIWQRARVRMGHHHHVLRIRKTGVVQHEWTFRRDATHFIPYTSYLRTVPRLLATRVRVFRYHCVCLRVVGKHVGIVLYVFKIKFLLWW